MDELQTQIDAINSIVFEDRPREKAQIRSRQPVIASALQAQGSSRSDGLGQHIARIDARVYWRWDKELPGCWQDKKWVDEFLRDNPCYLAPGYKPRHR